VARLHRLRGDDDLKKNYIISLEDSESLQLALPQERRTANPPLQYEATANCSEPHVVEKMRQEYFTTLDLQIAEVERLFNHAAGY
jgi:hypothetical protein